MSAKMPMAAIEKSMQRAPLGALYLLTWNGKRWYIKNSNGI